MKIDVQCTMMVIIAKRFHLFPFRTQKLSSYASTIFGWRRPEKIDRCHQPDVTSRTFATCDFFVSSKIKWGPHKIILYFAGKRRNCTKREVTKNERRAKSEVSTRRRPEKIDRCLMSQIALMLLAIFLSNRKCRLAVLLRHNMRGQTDFPPHYTPFESG